MEIEIFKIIKKESKKFITYFAYYLNNIQIQQEKIGYLKISKKDKSYELDINVNDLQIENININSIINLFMNILNNHRKLL